MAGVPVDRAVARGVVVSSRGVMDGTTTTGVEPAIGVAAAVRAGAGVDHATGPDGRGLAGGRAAVAGLTGTAAIDVWTEVSGSGVAGRGIGVARCASEPSETASVTTFAVRASTPGSGDWPTTTPAGLLDGFVRRRAGKPNSFKARAAAANRIPT